MAHELNEDQSIAFEFLKKGENLFITGPGGTGKSFLIDYFYNYAITKYGYDKVFKTSTTGVSALLIGGTTIHSWSGINLGTDTMDNILKFMKFTKKVRWKKTKVLIIDEISMLNPDIFDKIENLARILRNCDKPFGGIQVVLLGDFFQLPVVKCERFCFQSTAWKQVIKRVVNLNLNVRQEDKYFQELLCSARLGELTEEYVNVLKSLVGKKIENNLIRPTILYSRNIDVDKINMDNLLKLNQPIITYDSSIKVIYNNLKNVTDTELIQRYTDSKELKLCVGAQVMIKKNIDIDMGIVNGSRGVIVEIKNKYPIVQLVNGNIIEIKEEIFDYESTDEYKIKKIQLPLKLAWATTIHNSQGSTLDCVEADLGDTIFEYGQGYVVLSRVKTLENLTLISFKEESIRANPTILEASKKNWLIDLGN
jgi:ATP-dependent DNA helicase PIF1